MGPLRFKPILKRARWGGRRLGTVLNKRLADAGDYAESWEIAHHSDGLSCVAAGSHRGSSLSELIAAFPQRLLGSQAELIQFPLMIKYLDATDRLSLQVHPNDAQARAWNMLENGKTECWIILDVEPGSRLYAGLKPGVSSQSFCHHLAKGFIEDCLHQFIPEPGDCVLIPAGTVHAISEGVLLAEIQQTSNLTFRIHDWGRLEHDGRPRETHLDQALQVIDFARGPITPCIPTLLLNGDVHNIVELVHCEHFQILRHTATAPFSVTTNNRFQILMNLEGHGEYEWHGQRETLAKGDTILLPASAGEIRVIPDTPLTLLQVWKP